MNMASIEVFVKAGKGDLQRTSPPYRYNDIAKYTCNLGFVLEDPFEQSLCHGENAWTGNPSCVCTLLVAHETQTYPQSCFCIACAETDNGVVYDSMLVNIQKYLISFAPSCKSRNFAQI